MSQTKVVAALGTVLRVLIKSLTDSVRRKMLPLWIANLSDASASSCTASNSAGWSTALIAAWLSSQPGSHRSTSPPITCFASCFVYGKAYSLVFEFLSITSSLGKSDYRDNLLNSEEFQFVSIEFCQFRIPDTFVFQSIDWSLPARRSGICFHSLRN